MSNLSIGNVKNSDTRGLKGFQFPSNVGILVDNENPFLVMETFYVNPNAAPLQFDTSGVRVHYTSRLRKFAVGSLFLGDPLISRSGQQVIDGHRYQHSCPKSCTSRFQRAINVFNSFSYMRGTGRSIRTNMFRPNGKFVQRVNEVSYYIITFCLISFCMMPCSLVVLLLTDFIFPLLLD